MEAGQASCYEIPHEAMLTQAIINNQPGRRAAVSSPPRIGFGPGLAVLFVLALNLAGVTPADAAAPDGQIAAVKSQMNEAIFQSSISSISR